MRRAKIVCTIGPATESAEQIQALVDAGMDVARLNRSHGDTEVHERVYNNVRAAAKASGRSVAVLVDLQGPKIRLGRFTEGKHELAVGDVFTITTEDVPGTKELVSTTHKGLPGDARVGDPILIDDGRVLVRVTAVEGPRVVTRVEVPGPVSNNKGLNLPGVAVSVPAMSDKDESDLRWALQIGADLIALSFVRSAADYDDVRRIMDGGGPGRPGHRQDREAAGRGEPRRDRRRVRRHHGRPRRPGRRAAARAGPAGAEARGRARPPQRQAGHRRDPGARVDDLRRRARRGPRRPTAPTRCSTAPTPSCSPARPASGSTRSRPCGRWRASSRTPRSSAASGSRRSAPRRTPAVAPSPAPPPRSARSSGSSSS